MPNSDTSADLALYGGKQNRRVTTADLVAAKVRGEKWPMIT